ncbi:MAG TPA: cytochrome c, partial [Bacteroidia bacterium]|nr:cytochrome c [Bacteroidia bacterium]
NQELSAIQPKYPNVTLATLQQGFTIYSVGKCINCHGSKNIYNRSETQWKDIMDDMAQRANISDAEKDAVYKYVLAIKAAQPK